MTQDNLYMVTCRRNDIQDLLQVFHENKITPSILGSTVLVCTYMVQLSGSMQTYLTLKFPNIGIKPAKFVNGKI